MRRNADLCRMPHKAGFVNIIGRPNAGKSTLMNALVGERVSIITSKAQTTRHRILGIVNGEDFQVVYSDTPGILKPQYKLHQGMMHFVNESLSDADVLLFVVDLRDPEPVEEATLQRIKSNEAKLLVLLNKTDIATPERILECMGYWQKELPKAEIIPICALKKERIDLVFERILALLPEHEAFYDKDALTDKPERFFIAEIIREKILLNYQKEIPYSVEVVVESFKEDEKIVRIRAEIYVARESQKAIIIGHKGAALKKVGIASRQDMETFLGKQVHLELFVKVDKEWRDSDRSLRKFGYL